MRTYLVVFSVLVIASMTCWFVSPSQSQQSLPKDCERRIPISRLPFTIEECGSYYLTGCLVEDPENPGGITISADYVTLDLNGFALLGSSDSGSHGIRVDLQHSIKILNGSVGQWSGIGVNVTRTDGMIVDLRVRNNGSHGIVGGDRSIIRDCLVRFNGDDGIVADGGCMVFDNIVASNGGDGVVVNNDCTVRDNTIDGQANGAGVCVIDGNGTNLILRNHLTSNDRGVDIKSSQNIVINNTAQNNVSANYTFVGGNDVGPIGAATTATSPSYNVQFP